MPIIENHLRGLANSYDINLVVGDFPYCSYVLPSYDNSLILSPKPWWDIQVMEETIMIPYIKSGVRADSKTILGFFHELGHILDHRNRLTFKTELDCEYSAWLTGLRLFNKSLYKPYISKDRIQEVISYCLGTYME